MSVPGGRPAGRVRRGLRRLAERAAGGAPGYVASKLPRSRPSIAVIAYHRVLERRGADPWSLVVTAARFREQLAMLAARYPVFPLRQALEDLEGGGLPARQVVCVTFDDGYRDLRTRALPILEDLGVPATLFLSTGSAGGREPYWWDRLAGSSVGVSDDLHRRAKGMPWDERDRWIEQPGGKTVSFGEDDLPMSFAEVRALPGLVSVGGHGHRHVSLGLVSPDDAAADVSACAEALCREVPAHVPLFAYPFGGPEDWSLTTEEAVRRAGFVASFTTRHGVVRSGASRFRLPRIRVENESAGSLALRLLRVFAARDE